jgi:hypothetical protein
MIQLTVVGAVAAVIGGVVAITGRDSRLVAAGLFLAMVAASLVSSPEPTYTALVFRVLGALLAAYLLWAATRNGSISSEGSYIGVPAEVVAAAAAFCVGWYVVPVKPLAGPLAAQAAGIALVVLALGPLAGRNILRGGVALAVIALGISLLMEAWTAPASSLDQIVTTAVLVGIVGATGLLIAPTDVDLADDVETEGLADEEVAGQAVSETDTEPEALPATGRARRLGVREPHR